jgi:hypothetical protein
MADHVRDRASSCLLVCVCVCVRVCVGQSKHRVAMLESELKLAYQVNQQAEQAHQAEVYNTVLRYAKDVYTHSRGPDACGPLVPPELPASLASSGSPLARSMINTESMIGAIRCTHVHTRDCTLHMIGAIRCTHVHTRDCTLHARGRIGTVVALLTALASPCGWQLCSLPCVSWCVLGRGECSSMVRPDAWKNA